MNLYHLAFFILAFGSLGQTFTQLQAQELSPAEEAEIKQELKTMKKDLILWKAWSDRAQAQQREEDSLRNALDSLKITFDLLADEIAQKEDWIDSLQTHYHYWLKRTRNLRDDVLFRVQVAGYQRHPIDRFHQASPSFYVDRSNPRVNRYMLGFFRSYWEAKSFSDQLKRYGLGCYIVAYHRGQRVHSLSSWIEN